MNRKKVIIFSSALVLLIGVIAVVFVCIFGNSINRAVSQIDKSMKTVQIIDTKVEVKDQDVVVYRYNKIVEFEKDNLATIKFAISNLNSNYELEEKTNEEKNVEVNREQIFSLDLDKKYFSSYEYRDNVLTCEISKENIQKLFNQEELEILNNASLTVKFEDKKITNMICVFKTTSSKDVVINITYQY